MSNDDDLTSFYASVGQVVCHWQAVEASMGELYLALMNPANPKAAMAAFFAVFNLNARLAMLDATAINTLDKKTRALWKPLSERLGKHSQRRNHIVHGELFKVDADDEPLLLIFAPTAQTLDFIEHISKAKKWPTLKKRRRKGVHIFDRAELETSAQLFEALHSDLDDFIEKVFKTLKRPRYQGLFSLLRR